MHSFFENSFECNVGFGADVDMMSCYSGMMSAMEEIQARADGIMENIMQKEGELAQIQQQAREAEREKQTLEADM